MDINSDFFNIETNKDNIDLKTFFNDIKIESSKKDSIIIEENGQAIEVSLSRLYTLLKSKELFDAGIIKKGQNIEDQIKIAELFSSLSEETKENLLKFIKFSTASRILPYINSDTQIKNDIMDLILLSETEEYPCTEAIIKSYEYEEVKSFMKNWEKYKNSMEDFEKTVGFIGMDKILPFDKDFTKKFNNILSFLNDSEKLVFIKRIQDITSQIKYFSGLERNYKKSLNKIPEQIDLIEKYRADQINKETFYTEIKFRCSAFNYTEKIEFMNIPKESLIKIALDSLETDMKEFRRAKFFLENERTKLGTYVDIATLPTKNNQEIMRIIINKHGTEILNQIEEQRNLQRQNNFER